MIGTAKIQLSILALSSAIAAALFAIFAVAPSVFWTSNSDWNTGTFTNTTNITGDLMLNNTIVNGTTTIYSWFYNNWTYRKAITINGSTSLQNNYQIMINLTNRTAASDNFNFARANSQGNDTRFTWLNTSSGLEQNISFWIENWTVSGSLGNATIWVKVPNVTASGVANTTLYMYYGNPGATYNNSLGGNNTFIFFDDGSFGTSKYTPSGATIGTSNGEITLLASAGSGWNAHGLNSISNFTRPYVLEWDDYASNYASTNYISGISPTSSLNINIGLGILHDEAGGGQTYVRRNDSTLDTAAWIAGKIRNKIILNPTSGFQVYYNNVLRQSNTTWTADNWGFFVVLYQAGNTIYLDNIRVRSYASPEPSMLSVGAEQTASSRGTYLSNTTTAVSAIASITPSWNATNSTNVNFTVEISANNGANWIAAANNTAYASGGGIGNGTQLKYRINFSTDNTSTTATVSDINMIYTTAASILWSANASKLSSPQAYSAGTTYGWQVNWTGAANATFQLGRPGGTLTNYTEISTPATNNNSAAGPNVWYVNFTQDQLGGTGTYNYTWFGIDASETQNKSDTVNYVITAAPTSARLFLNGTEGNANYNISQTANFTVSLNISGKTAKLDTNLSGWTTASGTSPLFNYTQLQQSGIYNITGYFIGDENYSASAASYFANITSVIGNITFVFALHLGTAFADDSFQNGNNYDCVQDGNGWFGLTSENPQQALSGNLSVDYNINVSLTSDSKAYLALGKGSCANFRNHAADAQLKRFLSPLMSFSYAKTNLIQLILQFNSTDVTNDAHWGKGTYLLSIANQGYNASSGKQNLAVKVVK